MTHEERVWHHEMETLEGIHEHAERIASLEELVLDMYGCDDTCTHCKHFNQGEGFYCDFGVGWKARRMRELGIEVQS